MNPNTGALLFLLVLFDSVATLNHGRVKSSFASQEGGSSLSTGATMVSGGRRRELRELSRREMSDLIDAFEAIRRVRDNGRSVLNDIRNTSTNSRQLIDRLEAALNLSLPYWDFEMDRRLPNPLDSVLFHVDFFSRVPNSSEFEDGDHRRPGGLTKSVRESTTSRSRPSSSAASAGSASESDGRSLRKQQALQILRRRNYTQFLYILFEVANIDNYEIRSDCALCPSDSDWLFCDKRIQRCVSKAVLNGNCSTFEVVDRRLHLSDSAEMSAAEVCHRSRCVAGRCVHDDHPHSVDIVLQGSMDKFRRRSARNITVVDERLERDEDKPETQNPTRSSASEVADNSALNVSTINPSQLLLPTDQLQTQKVGHLVSEAESNTSSSDGDRIQSKSGSGIEFTEVDTNSQIPHSLGGESTKIRTNGQNRSATNPHLTDKSGVGIWQSIVFQMPIKASLSLFHETSTASENNQTDFSTLINDKEIFTADLSGNSNSSETATDGSGPNASGTRTDSSMSSKDSSEEHKDSSTSSGNSSKSSENSSSPGDSSTIVTVPDSLELTNSSGVEPDRTLPEILVIPSNATEEESTILNSTNEKNVSEAVFEWHVVAESNDSTTVVVPENLSDPTVPTDSEAFLRSATAYIKHAETHPRNRSSGTNERHQGVASNRSAGIEKDQEGRRSLEEETKTGVLRPQNLEERRINDRLRLGGPPETTKLSDFLKNNSTSTPIEGRRTEELLTPNKSKEMSLTPMSEPLSEPLVVRPSESLLNKLPQLSPMAPMFESTTSMAPTVRPSGTSNGTFLEERSRTKEEDLVRSTEIRARTSATSEPPIENPSTSEIPPGNFSPSGVPLRTSITSNSSQNLSTPEPSPAISVVVSASLRNLTTPKPDRQLLPEIATTSAAQIQTTIASASTTEPNAAKGGRRKKGRRGDKLRKDRRRPTSKSTTMVPYESSVSRNDGSRRTESSRRVVSSTGRAGGSPQAGIGSSRGSAGRHPVHPVIHPDYPGTDEDEWDTAPVVYFSVTIIEGEPRRKAFLNGRVERCRIVIIGANMPSGYTQTTHGKLVDGTTIGVISVIDPEVHGPLVEFRMLVLNERERPCVQRCLNARGSYRECPRTVIRLTSRGFREYGDPVDTYKTEDELLRSQWSGRGYYRKRKKDYLLFSCPTS